MKKTHTKAFKKMTVLVLVVFFASSIFAQLAIDNNSIKKVKKYPIVAECVPELLDGILQGTVTNASGEVIEGGIVRINDNSDTNLVAGKYVYYARSAYADGLSDASNSASIDIFTGIDRNVVIIEVSTSTTCSSVPGIDRALDQMHEEGLAVGIIQYHAADAYQIPEGVIRSRYYSFTAQPDSYTDGLLRKAGGSYDGNSYDVMKPFYDERMAIASTIKLDAAYEHISDTNYTLYVDAEMVALYPNLTHDIVLHVAVTESYIEQIWQSMSELNFVCRAMFPDANGTNLNLEANTKQELEIDFTISDDWAMDNVEIVVFIQDVQTKEVLQGALAYVPLNAPENLAGPSAIDVNTDFILTWDAVDAGTNALIGYNIYQQFGDAEFTLLANTNDTTYTHNIAQIETYKYYVTAVYNEGESAESNILTINYFKNVNEFLLNKSIKLYPNPASDQINISASMEIITITVYDNIGQVVFVKNNVESDFYMLPTNKLNKGLYFMQLETEKGRVSKRFVVN
jgi:hypothetical protein